MVSVLFPFLSCEPKASKQRGSSSAAEGESPAMWGSSSGGISCSLIGCGMAPELKATTPMALVRDTEEGQWHLPQDRQRCIQVRRRGVCLYTRTHVCMCGHSQEFR